MSDEPLRMYFNPHCSKCRQARDILDAEGAACELYRYLDDAPSREEIEHVIGLLGIDDPRRMMRTSEAVYRELGLHDADRSGLIDAMAAHPILIERPIVIRGDRAVIARPPELLRELL